MTELKLSTNNEKHNNNNADLCPQQLVHIHVVILHKEEGAGLGFSIAGGSDLESKALTVSSVLYRSRYSRVEQLYL